MGRRSTFLLTALAFGYAFLYGPIAILILYSFNRSERVTVWAGWSTKWYGELLKNQPIIDAAVLSLQIAALSATAAVVLGTMAGFALTRYRRFRGRTLFSGMVAAPLVMPEILTGLSLLLLFVALERWISWPMGRGMDTIMIAHITFCLAYVAVIVQSRLLGLDRSIEEAAADLGARPLTVFFAVTLPMIAPALVAGWLLAFTLSLDDLVIASFVSGPGASTLPMVIFSKIRLGLSPEVNALATIIVGAVAVFVVIVGIIGRRQEMSNEPAGSDR